MFTGEDRTGKSLPLADRTMATGIDGFPWKFFSQIPMRLPGTFRVIGSREKNGMGAGDALYRLSQRTQGNQGAVSERIVSVEQQQVQVAFEPQMLESVVQDEDLRLVLPDGGFARAGSVLSHPDRGCRHFSSHEDRLIPETLHEGKSGAFRRHTTDGVFFSPIAPTQNGCLPTPVVQVLRQPQGEGSLSRPTGGEIAEADNKCGKTPASFACPLLIPAQPHGIDPLRPVKEWHEGGTRAL